MSKNYQYLTLLIKQSIDKHISQGKDSITIYNKLNIAEISMQVAFGYHTLYIKETQTGDNRSKVEAHHKAINPNTISFFDNPRCNSIYSISY